MGKILLAQNWKASSLGNPVLWQQSLKNSLNTVLNSNFPSILVWGFDYRCFYNDSYDSSIDVDGTSLLFGQSGINVFSDCRAFSKNIVDEILSAKRLTHSEDLLIPALVDGKKKNLNWTFHYNAVYDDLGNTGGVLVSCNEIRNAEKYFGRLNNLDHLIVEAEEKTNLAIESADLGTYELNLVTNEVKTSERFNKIWGVETNFLRSELAACIHPDDFDARAAAHRESLTTGNLHYEARIIHKDGSHHWIKAKGRVSYDNAGKPLMLIGVIQDITEQKTFTDELSKLVQERTEELQALNEELIATNEELIESNSHFTRVNKELEQFAHVASHDLQEPLRKIQTFSNIINQKFSDELSPNAALYLEKITTSASRMSNLIKDLLDYSRLSYNSACFFWHT